MRESQVQEEDIAFSHCDLSDPKIGLHVLRYGLDIANDFRTMFETNVEVIFE